MKFERDFQGPNTFTFMLTAQSCKSATLELIIGPMFSGKSTLLISRIRQHKIIGSNYVVVSHKSDTRYDTGFVVSHNLEKQRSIPLTKLQHLFDLNEYHNASVILVEEGQFFGDLYDFCCKAVEEDGKHVVVSGLDGDFKRKPFGQILDLIPLCDKVTRLSALCAICNH